MKKKMVPLDFRDRQSPIPHRLSVECLLKSQGEERGKETGERQGRGHLLELSRSEFVYAFTFRGTCRFPSLHRSTHTFPH